MYVKVVKERASGRKLTERELLSMTPLFGMLQTSSTHYRHIGQVPFLRLLNPSSTNVENYTIAELVYPECVAVGNGRMRWRGFEVLKDGETRSYMQEWLCELTTRKDCADVR